MPRPLALGAVTWDFSRPYLLGIVNVTPDSFSDGGRHASAESAIAHGEQLLAEGADALDIGGESTRPGASPVDAATELARVLPVVRALAARGAIVSIDTTKGAVADAALAAGARILNDVSMGDTPETLAKIARAHGAVYLRMHARGTPATMASRAQYGADVVADVCAELVKSAARIERTGFPRDRLVLDPGIGFAKRAEHSLALLAGIARVRALGYAVCVGPSRKSFIDARDGYASSWGDAPAVLPGDRAGGTAAAVALAVAAGAELLRVHDVAAMRQAARVAHAARLAALAQVEAGDEARR